MRINLFTLLMVGLTLAVAPLSAKAQALFDPLKITYAPSTLFPLVTPEDFLDEVESEHPSAKLTNKVYDRCLSKMPTRFTPDALQYYCACSAAAIQANLTVKDLKDLQNEKTRKAGNTTFEKYVTQTVSPCIDMPVEDIEYLYCVLYRSNDWRISYIPRYCKCVSNTTREYVKTYGDADIMISWGSNSKDFKDPFEALWDSSSYQSKRDQIREECAAGYMTSSPFNQ